MKSSILLVLLALPAAAIETRWTATGTVSSVTGTGLAATTGAPVSVSFSYDASDATVESPINFPTFSDTYYYGSVKLAMEVSIGENKWTASLPVSTPGEVIYVKARGGVDDILRVTAATAGGATFPLFPYTGSGTARSISVELKDSHSPSLFLVPQTYPDDDSCKVSSLSTATGEVKVGTDSIKFSINPASVTVDSRFELLLERTATGVTLRWPTEDGQLYLLMESDNCKDWEFRDTYVGDGQEKVVTIQDAFAMYPKRRFYRVTAD